MQETVKSSVPNPITRNEGDQDLEKFQETRDGSATANLPWGAVKVIGPSLIDLNMRPGEYVAQTLLVEFISASEKKIQNVLHEPLEKSLSKTLQRGEDSQFDQLITALYSVSEHCLPSILKALFAWYDYQNRQLYLESHQQQQIMKASSSQSANILMSASTSSSLLTKSEAIRQQNMKNDAKAERDYMLEKKGLAVDFIFCLVLIEILKQMPLHPGHDDLVNYVVQLAFKQFRFKELSVLGPNAANVHCIADLFAEVIGVLAQSRFFAIRKKFTQDLNELKGKEALQDGVQNIVSLFMGMKFFRVKMVPIEEFEVSMNFLYELGTYFLEAKDREIKHALAALFVEILIPVAANVKTEVNVPAVKNLVDLLYAHTLDLAAKRKHSLAFFPLLTCLLCISQKHFFLSNWHYFLTMCLSNLKNKDIKMSRVALESLYRLLWVYVVRIKCESNTATQSRLQSICNSLFPKGGRYVIPRETPLNLFVKILHFIAQERLDFAFKEVIFDLLCVGRPIRSIYPERMNIGLRALLVIADSLQQCDGPPPMPKTVSVLPSGNTLRVKRTYLTKPLTVDIARSIGIDSYYGPCLRSFEGMLRALDTQVGRPMMMTVVQNVGREAEDMLSGDRKPKLDLFRTCIAAMPRILPENMSRQEVVDLLLRLTIHMDEELKALACQTLQNIVVECRDWREDIIYGLLQFITKEIHDNYSVLLDSALRLLHQLLQAWKNSHQQSFYGGRKGSTACVSNMITFPKTVVQQFDNHVKVPPVLRSEGCALVLHSVEGLALVMLCQCRSMTRRLALNLMREIRQMLPILCSNEEYERPVIDVLDSSVAYVSDKYIQHVQIAEKMNWPPANQMDFSWALDRLPMLETDFSRVNAENGNEYFQWDAWAAALSGFLEPQFLLTQCPTAVSYAWPAVHMRISAIFSYVDPNNPQNDTRASLLRSSKSKSTAMACSESLSHNTYLSLWQKYLVFACGVAPPASNGSGVVFVRSVSPFPVLSTDSGENLRLSELRIPRVANVSASNLFRQILPLLRCEMADMRDLVVLGLGSINPASFDYLLEELAPFLREASERKQENLRRKKRKDLLRLQLIRLMEMAVFRHTISSPSCIDPNTGQLKQVLLDFLDNARLYLEADHDRDQQTSFALHLHFAKFVASLILGFATEKRVNLIPNELRKNLFYLFASWSGRLGLVLDRSRQSRGERDNLSCDEYFAVAGMCAILTCGPVFDNNAISDERGYIFGWMDALISSQHEKVNVLSEEALVLLLDYNSDNAHLLEWVVDKCFTSSSRVADKCFRALATIFSNREYPCDVTSMLNLALMYTGYPVTEMQQRATELLQILYQRYFTSIIHSQIESSPNSQQGMVVSSLDHSYEDLRRRDIIGNRPTSSASHVDDEQTANVVIRRPISMSLTTNESTNTSSFDPSRFSKSQITLSQKLAAEHPELTLQIFSEISLRICTAKPARRASMLHYLQPWIYNMELIDPYLEPLERTFTLSLSAKLQESQNAARRVLKGEGWGSQQATEMILNNLMYLTIKFGNEHAEILETIWSGLTSYWPNNLRVILRYLMVISTLAQDSLISYAKRIVLYIAHATPERLVEELMNELQTIDIFRFPIERCELPPFYRWVRRPDFGSSVEDRCRGLIHTRRHTPSENEPNIAVEILPEIDPVMNPAMSMTSLVTLTAENLNERSNQIVQSTILENVEQKVDSPLRRKEFIIPFQLPLPAYGGHYCPMSEYIPPSNQPLIMLHRSTLAIVFVSDLIISDAEIEWTVHMPLLLHLSILGLDSNKSLVNEHCRRLLINLLIINSQHCPKTKDVAFTLLSRSLGSQVSLLSRGYSSDGGSTGFPARDKFGSVSTGRLSNLLTSSAQHSDPVLPTLIVNKSYTSSLLAKDSPSDGTKNGNVVTSDLILEIAEFLNSKKHLALWAYEDVTARNWRIPSAEHLSNFVSHVVCVINSLSPHSKLESRWAQTALHIALCCSNRHCAGRSFQVLRALHVPLTSRMLFDILSRLVETVTETSEDIQGYVTEIMLTLEANVLQMEVAEHSLVSLFKGNLNLTEDSTANNAQNSPTHHRSVSHSVAVSKKTPDKKDWRSSVNSIDENVGVNIPRSKSAHAFKAMLDANGVNSGQDEHVVALSQLLWMAVSIMESDYEHEYLLALRLFEKLIDLNATERQDVFDRFDRMVKQLNWVTFPGILPSILKGCSFPNTYETTVNILNKMLPLLLEWPVLSSTNQNRTTSNIDFALCVTALMPYMLLHFDDPTKICVEAAENIAQICVTEFECLTVQNHPNTSQNQSVVNVPEHPLQLLAIIMRQYARRTFSKDCFQWTKCVILYLNDIYADSATVLLIFLTEVLDKGPPVFCSAVLQIMFCVFQHVDICPSDISSTIINGDFLKIVSRHVQGPNWREASRILKLAVTRSSSFAMPSSITEGSQLDHDIQRKELPGRTMEFRLDVTNLISSVGKETTSAGPLGSSPRKSFSSGNLEATIKKSPICNAAKIREHLLGLLNASGLRIGLPKSPSVIFSQSSHDHLAYIGGELPSSVYSSSGELTAIGDRPTTPSADSIGAATGATTRNEDETSENYAPVFKEFDFLEGEQDSMSETADSCFNWLSTIRPHSISSMAIDKEEKNSRKSSRALVVSGSEGDILSSVDRDLAHRSPSESSDEELEESVSSQADEESVENVLPSEPDQFAGESIAEERVATPASLSLCGSVGTPSVVDLSSHHFPPFNLECTHHATGQIDEIWTISVGQVSNDADGIATSASMLVFGQLYREACSKMCSLVRDACHFLSMTQIFREISSQFSDALHTLMRVADCPFVFITNQTLTSSNMLQRQKYYLLELREHYETFQEKRQQTIKCLNSVKSSMKLQLMDQHFEENSTADQEVELCKSLHKLFFQLLLMCENYIKMIQYLLNRQSDPASNLTPELQILQREILRAINDLGSTTSVEHPPPHELPGPGQQRLINLLQARDFRHAILQLRSLRSHHDRNNDYFGCCEEVDVEILLMYYCKMIAESRYCYAVIGSESQLSENCTSLMENNLNLSTSVRSLNEMIKNRASTVDLSSES